MADITSVKGHMQIVIVYKAPQCKFQDLKDVLISKLLPVLNIKHSNILIMGDFNMNIRTRNNALIDFMHEHFKCRQIVSKVTTKYDSLLDLAFIKVNDDVPIETDVVDAYWSDHKVIYVAV